MEVRRVFICVPVKNKDADTIAEDILKAKAYIKMSYGEDVTVDYTIPRYDADDLLYLSAMCRAVRGCDTVFMTKDACFDSACVAFSLAMRAFDNEIRVIFEESEVIENEQKINFVGRA